MKSLIPALIAVLGSLPFTAHARPEVPAQWVTINPTHHQPGTVVVFSDERALYWIYDARTAIRYEVAVPQPGRDWQQVTSIKSRGLEPGWIPPAVVRAANPDLAAYYAPNDPANPMGTAHLELNRAGYAIHGTSVKSRRSIGTAASFGCIRMKNEEIEDLLQRVRVGTTVVKCLRGEAAGNCRRMLQYL